MHAQQAARVFPRRPGLPAEAGSVSGVGDREPRAVENLVAMHVRDRDLRRRDEKQVVAGAVGVLLELGELAGSLHRLPFHQKRRLQLHVSVLPDVHVDHEIDETPHQPRAAPHE